MSNVYENLGFETPKVLENAYGIKIYIGTKDKDDWCVEIPKHILKKKHRQTILGDKPTIMQTIKSKMMEEPLVFYYISEKKALSIASEWTNIAKGE